MKIALCGNPNVGKTTLFNRITRSDEPVGNWHGVTVDVRTKRAAHDIYISDLPGAYSLTSRTAEEEITRQCVLYGDYDVFVCVAEVNNLRRNLYMYMQLAELNKSVVLVVNMMDEARGKLDLQSLSRRLGVPVLGTSSKGKNPKSDIIAAAQSVYGKSPIRPDYLDRREVAAMRKKIEELRGAESNAISADFVALKTIECDEKAAELVGGCGACTDQGVTQCAACDCDLPSRLRYGYIDSILSGVAERTEVPQRTLKIDRIVLGRLALPIFLTVMAFVFVVTFEAGRPLSNLLIGLTERLGAPLESVGPDWVSSLLVDGVINGVGAVLAFLPQVVILFLLTALLQDSGYMSRVAFLTDSFFKKFGLSGRAAFSVVLGLGCSATAVLTARGISDKNARRRAAAVTSFCPCSARLAVFTAITSYFGLSGFAVAAMYLLGFAAALLLLKLMSVKPDDSIGDELIMEMPPYRMPQVRRVIDVVWRNVLSFLLRVGSVVMVVSIVMWALCSFSLRDGFIGGGETSIMCTLAGIIAPIFKPLGFGSWRAVTALISGVAAKETVISVIASLGGMSTVFASREAAISFMIFTCLYVPCVATISALAKENGIKGATVSVIVHTVIAYIASLVYYQSAIGYAADKRLFSIVFACVAFAIVAAITAAALIKSRRKIGVKQR